MNETEKNTVRGRITNGVGGIYTVVTDGGESLSCRVRGAIRIPGADSGSRTAGAYNTAARLDRPLCGDIVTAERGADARSGASDRRWQISTIFLPHLPPQSPLRCL